MSLPSMEHSKQLNKNLFKIGYSVIDKRTKKNRYLHINTNSKSTEIVFIL